MAPPFFKVLEAFSLECGWVGMCARKNWSVNLFGRYMVWALAPTLPVISISPWTVKTCTTQMVNLSLVFPVLPPAVRLLSHSRQPRAYELSEIAAPAMAHAGQGQTAPYVQVGHSSSPLWPVFTIQLLKQVSPPSKILI